MTHVKSLLPALALILAGCAPAVQNGPAYITTQSYSATCADALDALVRVLPGVRPAVFDTGGAVWSYYSVSRSGDVVTARSNSALTSDKFIANWTCQQDGPSARLRLESTGLGFSDSRNSVNAVLAQLPLLRG